LRINTALGEVPTIKPSHSEHCSIFASGASNLYGPVRQTGTSLLQAETEAQPLSKTTALFNLIQTLSETLTSQSAAELVNTRGAGAQIFYELKYPTDFLFCLLAATTPALQRQELCLSCLAGTKN
jgi:hypothetical protein